MFALHVFVSFSIASWLQTTASISLYMALLSTLFCLLLYSFFAPENCKTSVTAGAAGIVITVICVVFHRLLTYVATARLYSVINIHTAGNTT